MPVDVLMELPRAGVRIARVGALEEGKTRVSQRARHPWSRRPDPLAVAAALVRGLRCGRFTEGDIQTVAHEAACVARGYFTGLANRGYHADVQSPALFYDIPATLFAGAPEYPGLHRYLGDLIACGDPDPLHVVRKFRRVVTTYSHNHFLEMIGTQYPHEQRIRRQVRLGARDLRIVQERYRLLFVPSRQNLEPITSRAHIAALSRSCQLGAPVRELLAATRELLTERTDVAGWIEVYDLVSDYWWFYRAPFTHLELDIAPGSPLGDRLVHELHEFWLRQRDELHMHALANWEGSADVAARDFGTFCDLMETMFETGRYEDRWVFWAKAFPNEIHSNEEFRKSRHRRRADELWKRLREAYFDELGPDLGIPLQQEGEEEP